MPWLWPESPASRRCGQRHRILSPDQWQQEIGTKDMTTDNTSRNPPDRMDLPFVGLATFARQPACPDWDKLDGADVAILGIPIDTASSYRVGTRFGPRAIREVSMFHGFGPEGVFDCARSPGGPRWSALISSKFLRPTILPESLRCSPHGPVSISSGPFSTSAPSGGPDIDHGSHRDDHCSEYPFDQHQSAGGVQ
jgi:hypothetical protein